MEDSILRIAVVSDLHFVNKDKVGDTDNHSWLSFTPDNNEFTNGFWKTLLDRIRNDNLKADLLICPGDITTHAEPSALVYAWEKLNELAKALDCKVLATATGNHDVVTRLSDIPNPIRDLNVTHGIVENLKQLQPPYPLVDFNASNSNIAHQDRIHYFGADYLIHDQTDQYRLVVLNSCSVHTSDAKSYERGHITDSTLSWLDQSLKTHTQKKLGILVCHHHPIQHDEYGSGSYDFINGGTKLMDVLGKNGSWLVIHGHKHHAKLSYHMIGSKKITVFAAGTLSSHKSTLGKNFANQFYIIEADSNKKTGTAKGKINAYSWRGTHWALSKSRNDGVFTGIGFGDIGCLEELSETLAKEVVGPIIVKWEELTEKFPELNYCVPKDLEHLENYLRSYNVDMVLSDEFEILGLEKTKV